MKVEGRYVLVTGGAGFIGSHIVDKLLELRNNVVVYDNFDPYYMNKHKNIRQHGNNPKLGVVKGDILDYEQLESCMGGFDIVIHEAAQPGVRFSAENPYKTNTVNVSGTLNVLRAAKRKNVSKVIFASSSSVYGVPKHLPVDEEHPKNPISIYGLSKLMAEEYCAYYGRRENLNVVTLRYFTVYGPRQRPDMAIHKFTKLLRSGGSPVIYGDGNQTRDFTYVKDAVDATILAAEKEGVEGEAFNIGSHTRRTVNEVVELIKELIGKREMKPVYEGAKPEDVPHTYADISKAEKLLGYRPRTAFEDGLKEFVKWLQNRR